MLPFSKPNKYVLDTLIQKRFPLHNEINNFPGDLTDTSAKKNHWLCVVEEMTQLLEPNSGAGQIEHQHDQCCRFS